METSERFWERSHEYGQYDPPSGRRLEKFDTDRKLCQITDDDYSIETSPVFGRLHIGSKISRLVLLGFKTVEHYKHASTGTERLAAQKYKDGLPNSRISRFVACVLAPGTH